MSAIKINVCKIMGLALVCFAAGTIIQMFVPDIFIVILLAFVLLLAGVLLLKL